MDHHAKSIRPFIGSKNFEQSRSFYRDLGFTETELFPTMSVFKNGQVAFYLQSDYVKDWVDNSQIFLEVEDVEERFAELSTLNLPAKYPGVRLEPVRTFDWGKECYLHDPCGILWHFGEFKGR